MIETPPYITAPELSTIPGIRHGFFTRQGGHSSGFYDSLNCALGSGDDAAAVAANRAVVAASLGVTADRLVTLRQVHSAKVVVVDKPFAGAVPEADAMVTATPGLAVGILSADCCPVLFSSEDGKVIGAAHAGWKGALYCIANETIDAMVALGARRGGIKAVFGPCIAVESYEVSHTLYDQFTAQDRLAYESANGPTDDVPGLDRDFRRFFPVTNDKMHFNLPKYIGNRLAQSSIDSVADLAMDTYSDPTRFFSYRRTTHAKESDYGRQISAIVIT